MLLIEMIALIQLLQLLPSIIDLSAYFELIKNFGVAGIALVLMYYYCKYKDNQTFEKIEAANKDTKDAIERELKSQDEFKTFLQKDFVKNQERLTELTNTIKNSVESHDKALELIMNQVYNKNERDIYNYQLNRDKDSKLPRK